MQISQQIHTANIEKARIDFMDVYHDFYQSEEIHKKKNKNRRKYMARRAIEEYQEDKLLRAKLLDWREEG